jgi:hypothetical protein
MTSFPMQDHETLFNSFRFSSYFLFTLNSNGRPYNGGRMFVIISCATLLLLTPFCICSTGEMERHFSLANVIKIKTYDRKFVELVDTEFIYRSQEIFFVALHTLLGGG